MKLEKIVREELLAHGFLVGKMFDLSSVDDLQKTLYAGFQIVVLSAGRGNAVISRSPPGKTDGMREIVVYHNTDHYDLITSIDGFLMSGKYCEH